MKNKLHIIMIIIVLACLVPGSVLGQVTSTDAKMAKAVAKNALLSGDDIKFGIGLVNYSLKSYDGKSTGSNYNKLNTISLYGAYNYKIYFFDKFYVEYDLQLGKRFFKQDGLAGDEINLLTCDELTYYFFAIPLTLTYHHLESEVTNLSYSFGVFWEFAGLGEFKNEKGKRTPGFEGSDIHGYDWGLNFGIEFSFYGAFVGANYQFGYRNLAGDNIPGWEMKNKGNISLSAGFRFSSVFGSDLKDLILPGGKKSGDVRDNISEKTVVKENVKEIDEKEKKTVDREKKTLEKETEVEKKKEEENKEKVEEEKEEIKTINKDPQPKKRKKND